MLAAIEMKPSGMEWMQKMRLLHLNCLTGAMKKRWKRLLLIVGKVHFSLQASVDDDGEPVVENGAGGSNGSGSRRGREGSSEGFTGRKGGKFMEGVPGVSLFTLQVEYFVLHPIVPDMADTFPHSQSCQQSRGKFKEQLGGTKDFLELSLSRWIEKISDCWQRNHTWCRGRQMEPGFGIFTWPGLCTYAYRKCRNHSSCFRYMMLVDGENEVYFLDRDNCVFQVFVEYSIPTYLFGALLSFRWLAWHSYTGKISTSIYRTLYLMERWWVFLILFVLLNLCSQVIDVVNGEKFPRFLIYDIVRYEGNEVSME